MSSLPTTESGVLGEDGAQQSWILFAKNEICTKHAGCYLHWSSLKLSAPCNSVKRVSSEVETTSSLICLTYIVKVYCWRIILPPAYEKHSSVSGLRSCGEDSQTKHYYGTRSDGRKKLHMHIGSQVYEQGVWFPYVHESSRVGTSESVNSLSLYSSNGWLSPHSVEIFWTSLWSFLVAPYRKLPPFCSTCSRSNTITADLLYSNRCSKEIWFNHVREDW